MTKTLTMIYRHLNYKNAKDSNGKATGKAKLLKSLAHSLRINPNPNNKISETKKLEWDESKSDLNYVYSPLITGDKFVKLSELTEDEKKQIQESFITKMNAEQTAKDSKSDAVDTLSKYKSKINKWHNSISDDRDNLKKFLAKILEQKEIFNIENEINQLLEFDFPRKNQKTETARKFLQLHNEVIENKSDISRNKVFVQEAFFKIPDKNNFRMGTKDMINNIHSFYKNNFPDYPIQLIVFHGDEVGNHPHIFVDAQNKKTKKYDLLAAQNRFVNDHIEQIKIDYPEAEKLDFSIRSYKTKKLQAQYFQTLFYQHTNKILAPQNVQVKKLEKTDEHNARMALIEEDAKKPKIERQFSFYNAQINELQEQSERLEQSNSILSNTNIKLADSITEKNKTIGRLNSEIKSKNDFLDKFKERMLDFRNTVFTYINTFFDSHEETQKRARNEVVKKYHGFDTDYEKYFADDIINKTAENLSDSNASKLHGIRLSRPK